VILKSCDGLGEDSDRAKSSSDHSFTLPTPRLHALFWASLLGQVISKPELPRFPGISRRK